MFWGLILKNNKKYSQTVSKAFHLSQVVLDLSTCGDDSVQVMLMSETITYVLCNLKKGKVEQWNLDLNFAEGDKITLFTKGEGAVHLSGYLIPEDLDDFDMMGDEEIEEDEEEDVKKPMKSENGSKKERVAKKVAEKLNAKEVNEVESDEDPDETFDASSAAKEAAEVSEDDSDAEEEEGDDDDDEEDDEQVNGDAADSDDSDDDEEEDESDDDSDEEVEQPKAKVAKLEPTKSKQNGVEMNGKPAAEKKDNKKENASPKMKTLQGGLMVEDLKAGSGKEASNGKKVAVFYEGRLKKSGKVFDATKNGAPFKFHLGRGEVIKAWDVGVAGMKVGGKRRLVCPPQMAYGNKGSPPVIPPNSTLVFDVELKNVF